MEKGKILTLIAGIFLIFTTFMVSWFSVASVNAYGIGLIKNLPEMFGNAESIAISWGSDVPTFAIYIVAVCYIVFLLSGVIILLGIFLNGIKSRIVAIIGAIMPILLSFAILFGSLDLPPNLLVYVNVFLDPEPIVEGFIPLSVNVGPTNGTVIVKLGTYLLLGSGILGLISGILPREEI
ncbi:MAG: hypothetical protein KGD63_09485 [Candidatus Lokiarchaeota archaeon]|nr:hypothetical protein [Candidatus Lokiarchaeota archaeon]